MEKTKNKKTHRYANLFIAELRNEMSIPKILAMVIGGLLFPILISYIGLFIGGAQFMAQFQPLLISAIATFVFARVISSVREKATVDKNKAAFLYYDKHLIVLTKLIMETFMFIIGYTLLVIVGGIAIAAHPTMIKMGEFMEGSFSTLPGFLALYLFVYSMGKWMISFIPKKGAAIAASFFFALVMLTPIYILNQIGDTTVLKYALNRGTSGTGLTEAGNWFSTHQNIVMFIPYFNVGMITGVSDIQIPGQEPLKQLDHAWYVIVPIFMMLGSIAASFKLQSSAQKRYLSAS